MAILKKAEKAEVIKLLLKEYPDAGCELDFGSEFQLLVAVVLSAQTTDKSVNKVTPALFAAAPDAQSMAALPEEEIQELIRTIGMYRTKAHNVKSLALMLCQEYDGIVPASHEELVKLPGVGRKTANVVMAEAFGEQAIAVDTHVFRLANRIGLVKADNVLDTELALQKVIPHDSWTKMHHALIWHGRRVCAARKPACENCCIAQLCKHN